MPQSWVILQFPISTIDMGTTHSCPIGIRMDMEKQSTEGSFHNLKFCIKEIHLKSQWNDDWCSSWHPIIIPPGTLSGSKQTRRASRKVCAPWVSKPLPGYNPACGISDFSDHATGELPQWTRVPFCHLLPFQKNISCFCCLKLERSVHSTPLT